MTQLAPDSYNRRNDFAGLLNHYGVADPDVFAPNLFLIVQGRPGHSTPGNNNWFQSCHRSQDSSSTDLDQNIQQFGLDLFRFILESHSPPRSLGRHTEGITLRVVIDLYHRTIRLV